MPQFMDLPRELRDMIYVEVVTMERPRPTLREAQWLFQYQKFESPAMHPSEYGCAFSLDQVPSTCANLLRCSRQIFEEMRDAIQSARKHGRLAVKLDCIVEDESYHYFTWLAIPLVKTTTSVDETKSRILYSWTDRVKEWYLPCPPHVLTTVVIEKLWVDVRLFGNRSAKYLLNNDGHERTSWAICAALRRLLLRGADFSNMRGTDKIVEIDELVLNVVTPANTPVKYLPEDFPPDSLEEGMVHPRTVAKELLDVWNKIWVADGIRGGLYSMLIERIKR
ncbi:hypothetical protein BCR34DRAFT_462390, partial [Clohesyomyces aquaticus]